MLTCQWLNVRYNRGLIQFNVDVFIAFFVTKTKKRDRSSIYSVHDVCLVDFHVVHIRLIMCFLYKILDLFERDATPDWPGKLRSNSMAHPKAPSFWILFFALERYIHDIGRIIIRILFLYFYFFRKIIGSIVWNLAFYSEECLHYCIVSSQ